MATDRRWAALCVSLKFLSGRYGQCPVAAPKPPSPIVSGALPTSRGMRPVMGPPFAAAAGVLSVWLAPALALSTVQPSGGVMPWTCPNAGATESAAAVMTSANKSRNRRVEPRLFPVCGQGAIRPTQ